MADLLQDSLGDELVRLPPGLMRNPKHVNLEVFDERLIWVFPIHAWGLPTVTEQVIKESNIFSAYNLTHYMVATCGDDIGYADKHWRELIKRRGWTDGSAFSVQMPNIYVFMKGFDIDSPEVTEQKLDALPDRIEHIAEIIDSGETDVVDVTRGRWPAVKSNILRQWFHKHKMSTKPFRVNMDCNSCGKCARNCPLGNIELIGGKPKWADACVMCSRCYHCCPNHAIEYGNFTKGKGQYMNATYTLKK